MRAQVGHSLNQMRPLTRNSQPRRFIFCFRIPPHLPAPLLRGRDGAGGIFPLLHSPFPPALHGVRGSPEPSIIQGAFRIFLVLEFILLLTFPSSLPAQDTRLFRQSRILMGTSVEITVSRVDLKIAEEAMEAAFQEVERINRLMSLYRPDSEVSRIIRHAGKKAVRVSPETLAVIERALYFSRLSQGSFDSTIGPVFRLWNFREGKIPGEQVLKENLERVDYRRIKIDGARSTVWLTDARMEDDTTAEVSLCYVCQAQAAGSNLLPNNQTQR